MDQKNRISFYVLVSLIITIFAYRISNVKPHEISWDVLGYYSYLPATFIQHDPLLKDISWLKKAIEEKQLSGTMYMISYNEKGEPMYFFLMGMALFYLPFFLLALLFSIVSGMPVDAFSLPFQYALVTGGIFYTSIGLIFLRKIFLRFFIDKMTSLLLIVMFLATNYINQVTIKNLETVNVLFMLTTVLIWNTIKWHETFKFRNFLFIGISFTLMGLVKPSEIFVILIPLLWNVKNVSDLNNKLQMLYGYRKQFLYTVLICLIFVLPQMLYWYTMTGHFIYDSYKNSGVGLDIFSPHIGNILFSYRKGWLLYTPVMVFSLAGFYFLYLKNKQIFIAMISYFLISFYIMASWTEWWYGGSFSGRPMVTMYPVLLISLGYFINFIAEQRLVLRILFGVIVIFFIFLNQFQWWQYKNLIIDPYRMTKEHYWSVFLKTKVDEEMQKNLLVFRNFSGKMEFNNRDEYFRKTIFFNDFNMKETTEDSPENKFLTIPEDQEFYSIIEKKYKQLTDRDHAWVVISYDIEKKDSPDFIIPLAVTTMEYDHKPYGYFAYEPKTDSLKAGWYHFETVYLTPEIRRGKDIFKLYFWNKNHAAVNIDNLKVELYVK